MSAVPRNTSVIDDALRIIREATFETDVERINVEIRRDGRVTLTGVNGSFVRWQERGDLLSGGPTQCPSAAFCDAWQKNQDVVEAHGRACHACECIADGTVDASLGHVGGPDCPVEAS